jgi:hypothetical protein
LAAVLVTLFGVAAPATGGHAATGLPRTERPDLCAAAVAVQERRHGIPDRLMTAISRVESGRWDARTGKSTAWPWTVTAQGKGRFFPTKSAAIAAVRRLQARGITSIDVGCMQVNLHFHPTAFRSLSAAFDPARNAAYAATFLTALKRDRGSWRRAVEHYHSSTAEKRIPYRKKVYAAWRDAGKEDRASTADARGDANRIRRIGRRVERDHRRKISDYRRGQARPAAAASDRGTGDSGKAADDGAGATEGKPNFLASWPPRNAHAQFRAQNLARAWAFGGASRNVRR